MKIALITDTHAGIRNDSIAAHNYMKKFLDEIFFPYIDNNNIDTIIHLGDIVDRRKYINIYTAKRLHDDFLIPIQNRNIDMHIIAGNHDTYFKNTNSVNALREIIAGRYNNIKLYDNVAEEIEFDGIKMLFVPWICDENRLDTLKVIDDTKAQICMGHLELAGFEMYRGAGASHGDDPNIFNKFDIVCSGHYHHRSSNRNIFYLGAPCEYTWVDFNDPKGFHIFDTETRELEFIRNPYVIFHKFHYDDLNKQMTDVLEFNAEQYKSCYVKIVVRNKTNPYWFDLVVDKLEKSGTIDLQVVEDHFHMNEISDEDIFDQAEDTLTITRKYINNMKFEADKNSVHEIIIQLYNEAQTME